MLLTLLNGSCCSGVACGLGLLGSILIIFIIFVVRHFKVNLGACIRIFYLIFLDDLFAPTSQTS